MTKTILSYLSPMRRGFTVVTAVMFMYLVSLNSSLLAAENSGVSQVSESQLRVAYVFNFTKFITWPEGVNTDDFLSVCTYKAGPAYSDFLQLNERVSGAQTIQVLDVQNAQDNNLNLCDFLYIGSAGASTKDSVLDALSGRAVLTISEQALQQPSVMVSLMIVDNKIAFEVDLQELRKNALTVSSYMLRLAMQVYE